MPATSYRVPDSRPRLPDQPFRILCRPESGGAIEFDLSGLPISDALRMWFIKGLVGATGPSGSARTVDSARSLLRAVRSFSAYLESLQCPPDVPQQLRGFHWDGWILTISAGSRRTVVGSMRSMLRYMPEVPDEFLARSLRNRRDGHTKIALPSYTEAQFITSREHLLGRLAAQSSNELSTVTMTLWLPPSMFQVDRPDGFHEPRYRRRL